MFAKTDSDRRHYKNVIISPPIKQLVEHQFTLQI